MFLREGNEFNEDTEYVLRGNCEFLAAELNEIYGYKIEAAIALYNIEELPDEMSLDEFLNLSYEDYSDFYDMLADEEVINEDEMCIPKAKIIHCYNTFIKDGVKYYVDARGITSDEELFFSIFYKSPVMVYREFDESAVMVYREFSTWEELKTKNISTYCDWYGDDEFFKKTFVLRYKPAELYIEKYPELFV